MKNEIEKTTFILQGISAETKRLFKAWCSRYDISMKKKIEELMNKTIENDK